MCVCVCIHIYIHTHINLHASYKNADIQKWENSLPSQLGLFVCFPKFHMHMVKNSMRLIMENRFPCQSYYVPQRC